MARVTWTEPALADLNEIAEYITLDKIEAAKKLVKQVFASTRHLQTFPESGRIPPELPNSRYRELIVGPCRVFYRFDHEQERAYILYIMRTEQQIRRFILDER
ncbi:MAG: type II toxin-antitoxin system RelE/ParE family toxin [Halioglobus sp.]